MSALSVAKRPEPVSEFIEELEEADEDEHLRELRLQVINGLVRFSQRFYIAFFAEEFQPPIKVKGFLYRDKRRVARRLVKLEDVEPTTEGEDDEDLSVARIELAEYFESLVDSLQGDLDFGYSVDLADFGEFHNEIYPGWLESLSAWCDFKDAGETGSAISDLASEYRDVVEI